MASVKKRTWTHEGKTKSAYAVRWKAGGRHCSKQFELKKDAESFKRKVEREIEDGTHVAVADRSTMAALAEQFIRYQEDRMRDGRIGRSWFDSMNDCINLNIIPLLGSMKVAEVGQQAVLTFYRRLCRERGLSPFTAKLRVKVLGTLLDYGRKHGATRNTEFMREVFAELRGVEHKDVRTFNVDEMRKLLDAIAVRRIGRQHRPHLWNRCFVGLAAFCGLRFGEISGLTLPCIDFERGVVHVRHSLTDRDELKSPKTKSGVRTVPVPAGLLLTLREWVDTYYISNPRGLVFRTREGRYMARNSYRVGNWHTLLKWAGLYVEGDAFHFHALRHFAASWMVDNGMGLADVANLLGHRKFDVTLRTYTHAVNGQDHRQQAIERMAAKLLITSDNCASIAQNALTH